jgi:hypothetical protein
LATAIVAGFLISALAGAPTAEVRAPPPKVGADR